MVTGGAQVSKFAHAKLSSVWAVGTSVFAVGAAKTTRLCRLWTHYTGDIKRCRGSIFTSGILCSQTITKKEQKTSLDGLAGSTVFGTIRRVVALMTNCLVGIMVLKVTSSA